MRFPSSFDVQRSRSRSRSALVAVPAGRGDRCCGGVVAAVELDDSGGAGQGELLAVAHVAGEETNLRAFVRRLLDLEDQLAALRAEVRRS